MSLDLQKAYTEVNMILKILGDTYQAKVPKKLLQLFRENQNDAYHPIIDKNLPIEKMNISREALVIVSILNLKYWEIDASKKEELKAIYRQNQLNYQKKMGII